LPAFFGARKPGQQNISAKSQEAVAFSFFAALAKQIF